MPTIVPPSEPTPWRLTPARAALIRVGVLFAKAHPRNRYTNAKALRLDPLSYKAALRYWENGRRARARRGLPPSGPSEISPAIDMTLCFVQHAPPGSTLVNVIPHRHPIPSPGPIRPPAPRPRS